MVSTMNVNFIEQAATEAGIEPEVAKLMSQSEHVKAFVRVIADRQRQADATFINKSGRTMPVACQQKAVRHILDRLEEERLVTE